MADCCPSSTLAGRLTPGQSSREGPSLSCLPLPRQTSKHSLSRTSCLWRPQPSDPLAASLSRAGASLFSFPVLSRRRKDINIPCEASGRGFQSDENEATDLLSKSNFDLGGGEVVEGGGAGEPAVNQEEQYEGKRVKGPSALASLALLERYTSESEPESDGEEKGGMGSSSSSSRGTIAEQLATRFDTEDTVGEVRVKLGDPKKMLPPPLNIHQKRNLRRAEYLYNVGNRNDIPFFAAVAAFILLPPVLILGVSIAVGYVELLP
eukprot:TRINITY_DN1253_c0_g2_i1.p1 TRINITY_DN1253_c0_g2~~TRINITY_DN1253_c0_g2_i1.p1  ORF type:complete len:264 (+),score=48.94 TRINITY_DN1253_c0_g2_i1:77-868(+)